MQFRESLKLDGGVSDVWKRASAVQDIPRYWHGTRSLEVAEENGDVVRVRVKFAFGGWGEAAISVDEEKRAMTIDYVTGPFTGRQVIAVSDDSVTTSWDVKFRSIYRIASKWNEGHFRSGTVHALERLARGSGGENVSTERQILAPFRPP
ncbi:MAG TPA: hypothetical protein VLU91_07400 [Nitrososphaerales archaeon]|nr:hypothetical protein [Nitrososphaerales archaeon]